MNPDLPRSRDEYPWHRTNFREDDLSPCPAQVIDGLVLDTLPWVTTEPRTRMDIHTAVRIAHTTDFSQQSGILALLENSEPVLVDELAFGPLGYTDKALASIERTTRWREALAARARMARQHEKLFKSHERLAALREASRQADMISLFVTCTTAVLAVGAAAMVYLWLAGM